MARISGKPQRSETVALLRKELLGLSSGLPIPKSPKTPESVRTRTGRMRAVVIPTKQCAVCQRITGELFHIDSLYVCLPCIADNAWFLKMQVDRKAVAG